VRLTLTGGCSPDAYSIAKPNLLITQRPLPDNRALAVRGIRLMTYPHQGQLPDVKTIDYLMPIWLAPNLRENNADDLLYHRAGVISECPRSNIFVVTRDNELITPAAEILNGVIRQKVLSLAADVCAVNAREVRLEELREAREVFVTSTTKNITPVTSIDSALVADGHRGPITQRLGELIEQLIAREIETH
jgi:D-alanine transaminase/branched-chain amino acid aminotransferase